jgi:hypothetical protein
MYFDYLTNKITTKNVHIYFFGLKIEFYRKEGSVPVQEHVLKLEDRQ